MAPNKRGVVLPSKEGDVPDGTQAGVISKEEVAARGSGTSETTDTYDFLRPWRSEKRVFFTGAIEQQHNLRFGTQPSPPLVVLVVPPQNKISMPAHLPSSSSSSAAAGLMFLTRLPCPGWCDHHPAYLMRSLQWFPLIGAIIGLWAAVWLNAALLLWSAPVAASISTLATVWITGCFHEDGLADCFDGFGGGWSKSQILRIMKDSRVGTYALVGMALVITIKLRCIEHLLSYDDGRKTAASAAAALIAVHAASRWTSLPLIYMLMYIQDEEDAKKGLYNWFAQSQRLLTPPRLIIGTVSAVAVPWIVLEPHQACIIYFSIGMVTIVAAYYGNAIIGGVVGDYLGATIQVAELACYLALSADWKVLNERWEPLAVLALVAALPVLYCRRIINYNKIEEC